MERSSVFKVPREERELLKAAALDQGLDFSDLLRTGVGYKFNEVVLGITRYSDMTLGQRADAKKETSAWHTILPMQNSRKDFKHNVHSSLPDDELKRGYFGNQYRGKHRSHTKGAGLMAKVRDFGAVKTRGR